MKRLLSIVFVISVVFGIIAGPAFANENQSNAQALIAQIEALQKKIEMLKARLYSNGFVPSSTGTATSGTAISRNPGLWIPPMSDDDRSNDEIIQLNNLKIESIAADPNMAGVFIVSASADIGIGCRKFMSLDSATGAAITCPMAPTRLYQIRVDGETRLFLRNRTTAVIGDFETGNRINAYGFVDVANYGVQALVLRNLDKPVVRTFVQLSNLVVTSVPADKTLPFVFIAMQQKGGSPCLDFGERGEKGTSAPCPMGMMASPQTISERPEFAPPGTSYEIVVESRTYVIDRERHDFGVGDFAIGDVVNVYGITGSTRGRVNAMVVRNLSKPTHNAVKGSLRVNVVDGEIACTQIWNQDGAPCGGIDGAIVRLFAKNVLRSDIGGDMADISRVTKNGVAVFSGIPGGAYPMIVSASGFESHKQSSVTITGGPERVMTVALRRSGGGSSAPITTPDSLTGTVGRPFSATFTTHDAGGVVVSYDWDIAEGRLPPGLSLSGFTTEIYCITTPCNPLHQARIAGTPTTAGEYQFTLRAKKAGSLDASVKVPFVITVLP